jgi:hypothetical protein
MGGVQVPWNGSRPPDPIPLALRDTDGDGILDVDEEPGHINDFDDDVGFSDDPFNPVENDTGEDGFDHDSDNDGIEDYPWGSDFILERADTNKTRYIGPPPPLPKLPVITGEDMTYIFIDSDYNASTGFFVNQFLGAEFMVNISGKGNSIFSKNLNRFNSTIQNRWIWEHVSSVDAALDTSALEAQFSFDMLGIGVNESFNVWFFTTDWREATDMSNEGINDKRENRGTRAGKGDVIINEIYPDTNGWVELYNPTNRNVDLTGWTITWSGGTYNIPAGTIILAGEYLVFNIGNIPSSDTVGLYNDKNKRRDETSFTNIPSSFGWGRDPAKTQNWYVTYPTPGGPNSIPEFSDIIVPLFGFVIIVFLGRTNSKAKLFKRRRIL